MEDANTPYLARIEWEPCSSPIEIAAPSLPSWLPPGCRKLTLRRNGDYRLVAELQGQVDQPPDHGADVRGLVRVLVTAATSKPRQGDESTDEGQGEALVAKVRSRLDTVMDDVAKGFAASPPQLSTVAARLVTVRYYRRFLDEARILWDDNAAETGGIGGYAR